MAATVVRGLLAGAAGTGAMTLHQELRSRLTESSGGGDENGGDPWERAPVPAQVARRALQAAGLEPPATWIGPLTNAVHWGYGTAWGGVFALVRRALPGSALAAGPAFGAAVWASSYAQLVPLGLYSPPWEYPPRTLAHDVGYHVTYGAATALAFDLLGQRRGR